MTDDGGNDICDHGKRWSSCSKCMAMAFCGCCGWEIAAGDWCDRCCGHIKHTGSPWDRTYFARTGDICRFAETGLD